MKNSMLHQYRLGYYLVGNQKILNKSKALIEATKTGKSVSWIFNEYTYSKIDWTKPIEVSLPELYRIRAQQLRDSYDHIMLYYSGGADSTNVLHAFLDNNIFIDEIVMAYPKPLEASMNNNDTGNDNYFSEIKYSALVHLDKVKHLIDSRTRIRVVDQAETTINLFKKEDWFEKFPVSTMITPAGTGRQISAIVDPELYKLYDQGKTVCQVYGVDKPMMGIDEAGYFAYFQDSNTTHAVPSGYDIGDLASKFFFLEFFYWTPDLPEIIVKQAQEIKKAAETNLIVEQCVRDFYKIPLHLVRSVFHPIIYCKEANALEFQTEKPTGRVYRPMDKWFWAPEYVESQQNYLNVINYLGRSIDNKYFVDNDVYKGLRPIHTKKYRL